jgi:hypothetical protein
VTIKGQEALRLVREAAIEAAAAGELPAFFGAVMQVGFESFQLAARPEPPDAALTLEDAAKMFGEPTETFRRRADVLKARIRRPGERRLRYLRSELERILHDRAAVNAIESGS